MKNSQVIMSFLGLFIFFQTQLSAQFKVQLIKIKCISPQEGGDDETYILVNDKNKVWNYKQSHSGDIGSGDLDNQDVRTLTHLRPFEFNSPIVISVWDDDYPDGDDLLGKLKINIDIDNYTKFDKIQIKEFGSLDQSYYYRVHYKVMVDN